MGNTKITTAQRFRIAQSAIRTTQRRVLEVQEDIVTGKRVRKASDDPGSFSKILNLRRIIADSNQFTRNITRSTAFSNVTDQTLQQIRDLVVQARVIGLQEAGVPADSVTRAGGAVQISSIRDSIIQLANTQVGERFIFSGTDIATAAYNSSGEYQGNQGKVNVNVGIGQANAINVAGSSFLSTDLDPDIFQTSAFIKGTAPVTDEFRIDGTNNQLVIRDQQPVVTDTTVTIAAGTRTGAVLAAEAELKINNTIKVVTSTNSSISIIEEGGKATDTINVTTGIKTGAVLATELATAINASTALRGATAAGGTGYAVTYNVATDEFTITGGTESISVRVGVASTDGALGTLMGFTKEPSTPSLSTVTDEALTGTKVTYDSAADQFKFTRSGTGATDFQVLSVGTAAASTAASAFGFSADSLQGKSSTSSTAVAFNVLAGANDRFSVAVDGGDNTVITIGPGVFTGESLASNIELTINNNVKQIPATNNTITILEDGGARSETFTIVAGTRTGAAIASELQTLINASTTLKGATAAGAAVGYTVVYTAATDKFTITKDNPAVSVGVDVTKSDLASLLGFSATSPFSTSVTSDTNLTGAKVDYNGSFKDSFTVTSPSVGAGSSIALTPGGAQDILVTLNLNGATLVASKSTRLTDLNGGKGVRSGSILITNRAGATFTVDLSTAADITDVITKIEAAVTGVKVTIGADGKRLILTDSNSPIVSNLIVKDVGGTTTAFDLGIDANIPGNITGRDMDPKVSAETAVSALRDGAGVRLGTVKVRAAEIDLDLGSKIVVSDILKAISENTTANAEATISADGKNLKLASRDGNSSALLTDITGSSVRDLGFQGGNNLVGLLDVLGEALLRNDGDTIQKTLDEFTATLDRIGLQQVIVGEVVRQFERISARNEEVILAFAEILSKEEDTDFTQAITEFSVFQTTLEAAFASTAKILQLSLLDFIR
ncbi:MAG: hypothetical protein VCF07_06525 [Nitrospinota bacterium]